MDDFSLYLVGKEWFGTKVRTIGTDTTNGLEQLEQVWMQRE